MFPPVLIGLAYASYRIGQNQLSVDALRSQSATSAKKITEAISANTQATKDLATALDREGELLRQQLLEMHQAVMANREVACPYCNQLISRNALICNQCQGILNLGPWDFIRIALLYRPELIMRDKETIAELQVVVKEITVEIMRIAAIEDERKQIELKKKIEIERAQVEEELKNARLKAKNLERLEVEKKAEMDRLAKQRSQLLGQVRNNVKELHIWAQRGREGESLNSSAALAAVRNHTNLTVDQFKSCLSEREISEMALDIFDIADSIMTSGKLSASSCANTIAIFETADRFGSHWIVENICRCLYLSRQFKKCINYAEKALQDGKLSSQAHDGILLDKLKCEIILKVAKIGHVERAEQALLEKSDYQNKLVIAASYFICGEAQKALSIRDTISMADLEKAKYLYEPDYEDNHEEIARFDEMVFIVIDS